MICSVCLNPCIDRTVEIDAFAYGGLNRIRASRSDGCGKGVNVALVAREMGMEASVIGFLFEENGRCIAERLESAGAGEDCIWLPGAVRTNLKVFDRSTARITEINEPGEQIPEEALERMVQKVREYAEICDTMVFTGSLPPGVPADFYRTLIEATAGRCRCVLDEFNRQASVFQPFRHLNRQPLAPTFVGVGDGCDVGMAEKGGSTCVLRRDPAWTEVR